MTLALTDRALLEAWSVSRERSADDRADALLATATGEEARDWPLARRHAQLAELHRSRWGDIVEAVATCPECADELEVAFDLGAVEPADDPPANLRLPTHGDIAAAAATDDPARAIVERCARSSSLTDEDVVRWLAEIERADPFGAVELDLVCPACETRWTEPLAIADFVAAEAQGDARSIAAEVHELALAYGWTEPEILTLPAERRRVYLELVG